MTEEPTLLKLHSMRLAAMAEAWEEQQRNTALGDLSFDERFGMLVDAEHLAREHRRLNRLLRQAELRISEACIEDVHASPTRGLEKATLRQLTSCKWLDEHLNVIVTGATGVGKSYLGCALGQLACRKGYKVTYRRLPRLFEELSLAKADGTYAKVLAKLAKADLLVVDDFGLGKLKDAQRHDLLEVMEDRYATRATLVTSQLPLSKWHNWIGEPTIADAILDRLVHNAYKIALKGPSKRKDKAIH